MSVMRSLIACLVSLILTVGSVASAVARHEMAGMTDVTLCGTDGTVTVLQIDATGKPAGRGHHCPQCLAAFVQGVLPAAPVAVGPVRIGTLVLPGLATAQPVAQTVSPLARGPPLTA